MLGSGKSSGTSGLSSGRCEKSCPPNRSDSRLRPTSGSDSSLSSSAKRFASASVEPMIGLKPGRISTCDGIAALLRKQLLQVGIEGLRGRLLQMRGEHRLGVARGELPAGVRGAGLHEHRPALRRARQVQRALHLVVLARVVDRPHALRVGIASAGAVVEHRIVGPAVPQALDHGHVLFGALVAVGVADLADAAEIAAGLRRPGGDDVPADAAAADVVERAELPREIVGLGVGGRGGRDQPDAARRHGQRRQRRDRLEPVERRLSRRRSTSPSTSARKIESNRPASAFCAISTVYWMSVSGSFDDFGCRHEAS